MLEPSKYSQDISSYSVIMESSEEYPLRKLKISTSIGVKFKEGEETHSQ
jgi:hypothetical protein